MSEAEAVQCSVVTCVAVGSASSGRSTRARTSATQRRANSANDSAHSRLSRRARLASMARVRSCVRHKQTQYTHRRTHKCRQTDKFKHEHIGDKNTNMCKEAHENARAHIFCILNDFLFVRSRTTEKCGVSTRGGSSSSGSGNEISRRKEDDDDDDGTDNAEVGGSKSSLTQKTSVAPTVRPGGAFRRICVESSRNEKKRECDNQNSFMKCSKNSSM